jgi:type VI secretion system secreted protein Hcp
MAVDMLLLLDGIKGESRIKGFEQQIDVLAWSWGMTQSGTAHVGGGMGSGKVNVNDISLTKYVDSSTNALVKHVCDGTHIPQGVLTVRKAGGKSAVEYIKLTLKDVLITSLSTGGSGGEDRLTENVSLNFAEFKLEYSPQKADGSADAAKTVGWNIAQNAAVG